MICDGASAVPVLEFQVTSITKQLQQPKII